MSHPEPQEPELESLSSSAQEASFAEILSRFEETHRRGAGGETRQGTVVAASGDSLFVDIGLKTEGILPLGDLRDGSGEPAVQRGDSLSVTIKGRDPEGYYLLSLVKVERPKDWSSLEKAFQEKRSIGGIVTGVVKGGLTVDVGVRAFLPASRSGVKDSAELEKLVGQEIACKIIELDVAKEDVVVDRRAVLEEEEARARDQLFAALQEGAVVKGTVSSLTDYGAFVDLGGVDGLLHVGDMSWGRVRKPSDLLGVGDEVEVKILKVDAETRRIALGIKQLTPDPWTLAEEKYKPGDRVRGKVVRVVEFGAFVELEPGVEGLIHLSDLSWSRKVRKPSDVVKPGEVVEAVVLNVNGADHRVALSLKQALGDPWDQAEQKFPVGSVVEGRITNLAKFGAFVELAEGLEGMIHVGDISAEKRVNHPQEELKAGQIVKAKVLEVDRAKRRIRLGLKQLQPTTTDEYISEHRAGDTVTGRVVEIGADGAVKVQVAEGVYATCRPAKEEPALAGAGSGKADLTSLTAMLAAKWKQGRVPSGSSREPARTGQIRSFRILSLDPAAKRIELELAG